MLKIKNKKIKDKTMLSRNRNINKITVLFINFWYHDALNYWKTCLQDYVRWDYADKMVGDETGLDAVVRHSFLEL